MANVGPYNVMFMLPRFLVLTVKMVKNRYAFRPRPTEVIEKNKTGCFFSTLYDFI